MASIIKRLKPALASFLLWPVVGMAAPIIDDDLLDAFRTPVGGWANSVGTFVVDEHASIAGPGSIGYSTSSSLLSAQLDHAAFVVDGTNVSGGFAAIDLQINAIVQGNGTAAGNLLGGTLIARAGAAGIPELGAAPGEILLVGAAIDSAAIPSPFSVALLFDLTYTIPSLSGLGDFLTYGGAYPFFVQLGEYRPWGVDRPLSGGGFTLDAFYRTQKVPEPPTYAMMLVALVVASLVARRRRVT